MMHRLLLVKLLRKIGNQLLEGFTRMSFDFFRAFFSFLSRKRRCIVRCKFDASKDAFLGNKSKRFHRKFLSQVDPWGFELSIFLPIIFGVDNF